MRNPEKQLTEILTALQEAATQLRKAQVLLGSVRELPDALAESFVQEATDALTAFSLQVQITKLEAALEIIQEK